MLLFYTLWNSRESGDQETGNLSSHLSFSNLVSLGRLSHSRGKVGSQRALPSPHPQLMCFPSSCWGKDHAITSRRSSCSLRYLSVCWLLDPQPEMRQMGRGWDRCAGGGRLQARHPGCPTGVTARAKQVTSNVSQTKG